MFKIPLLESDKSNEEYFPEGQYDQDGQQVDNRGENSWSQTLSEVSGRLF